LLATESGAAEFGFPLETRNSMVPPTTVVPLAFLPVALKFCVPPTSREMLLAGLNVTLCTALFPGLALFLPRQLVSMATNAIMNVIRRPELQRCMNPPRAVHKREHNLDERKTVSVEGKVKGFKVMSCKSPILTAARFKFDAATSYSTRGNLETLQL
jgi:hypothetical protein